MIGSVANTNTTIQSQFGNVGGGNYAEFEADGSLVFYGTATVWDDARVPVTSTKTGGSKDPGFTVWKTDGGTPTPSQGIFIYWFDNATEEELYFTLQLPHGYVQGTNIKPHVHWIPKTNGSAGQVVSWGLEYIWVDISGTAGNTGTAYGNATTVVETLVAHKHYLTPLTTISGSGHSGVSSMIIGRVYRDATGGLATDSYGDDAGLLEIDFHFEIDRIGSRTEYAV